MRALLLDTNAYAAFKRGSPEAVEIIRRVPLIAVSSIVLGEPRAVLLLAARATPTRQITQAPPTATELSLGFGSQLSHLALGSM